MAIYKHTTETAIQKCKEVHGDTYDYSKLIYKNSKELITIICRTHGEFKLIFGNHTTLKRGCPKCTKKACDYTRHTKEMFIKKSNEIHKNKFDYSLVDYKGQSTKVKIICPSHGIFEQLPSNHYRYGCSKCSKEIQIKLLKANENSFSKSGFKAQAKNKMCTLYFIECWNETEQFYKIGITTDTVKRRFHSKKHMPYSYKILKEIKGEAEDIWTLENNLKQKLKSKYKPTIKFAGSVRECYSDLNEILETLN